MSTINVDNYGDGTSSVPASAVLEGTAKAWLTMDQTGTQAIDDSYNVSATTDTGTGETDFDLTNSMADTNWCLNTGGGIRAGTGSSIVSGAGGTGLDAKSSSGWALYCDNTTGATDRDQVFMSILGDLA